jgi:putative DNA methylase
MKYKKKLIEVALPLEAINAASASEKGNPFLKGHPRNLHQWWARRPHAAARAVIFAQMIDDPSEHPNIFKSEKDQEKERQRLFAIIEDIIKWENSNDTELFKRANDEILKSWKITCSENMAHPDAERLFDINKPPGFHDPFAGGGALPLEAQRLGLTSSASDLNPVAVTINKALIDLPAKFNGQPAVNKNSQAAKRQMDKSWNKAQGLAEDIRHYSADISLSCSKKLKDLYPECLISENDLYEREDLRKYLGKKLEVMGWIWARTVKSPNPAFSQIDVPLASTFMLSSKAGKEVYIEPIVSQSNYKFKIKTGKPVDIEKVKMGTKLARGANFHCIMSGAPISADYIKSEFKAGRSSYKLMAIVAEGKPGRVFISPTQENEDQAKNIQPDWRPDAEISGSTQYIGVKPYGITNFSQLFTERQTVALATISSEIQEIHAQIVKDAIKSGLKDDDVPIDKGGFGAKAYADAIVVYLALALDKFADYNNMICMWNPTNQNIGHLFTKQAIPMSWDFCESSPFIGGLSFDSIVDGVARTVESLPLGTSGSAFQEDCTKLAFADGAPVISTDPPYYDNVPYADLSDFFYAWMRPTLKNIFPTLFSTVGVPKLDELVAFAYRHEDGKSGAEAFFLDGMTRAMHRLAEVSHPAFPVTIYYAFKQSENSGEAGTASTGWETFLDAVIRAGFAICGTWPMNTERGARSRGIGANALATSIILVCRPRAVDAKIISRREFITTLKAELPGALMHLQEGNIAPVDLAQAAIGPGMAVYTRFSKVMDSEGNKLSVRAALILINQTLDEALAEQEGDFDADSRWALTWFDQHGFEEGDFGVAEQLSKSKNTTVAGLVDGGILLSRAGKVRLLKPVELSSKWNPGKDTRLSAWEIVHQLIRALDLSGEHAAAQLVSKLGSHAESARELCYRLYALCERKKRAAEAMAYNGLVQSWPEIIRLASEKPAPITVGTTDMFEQE